MSNTSATRDPELSDEEKRLLDKGERELVEQSIGPAMSSLSDERLSELHKLLRARRTKARDMSDRQAREVRNKAQPAGKTAATGNQGTLSKLKLLTDALERIAQEQDRRSGSASTAHSSGDANTAEGSPQSELSAKALKIKTQGSDNTEAENESGKIHPKDENASDGKAGLAATSRNIAPSGAFDDVGDLPSRERSRTRY